MFARVDTVVGRGGKLEEAKAAVEPLLEGFVGVEGFEGCFLLVGQSGKALWVTLWDTEEDLVQGAWGMSAIRDRLMGALSGNAGPSERFEVAVHAL
ncbi:MAG TPA: hypothetical protein VJN50_01220 [Actinomycetota bacterium]|nr:hypothetical protein [Actinomycetota bacterium]